MSYLIRFLKKTQLFTAVLISSFLFYSTAWADQITIPGNTRVYVQTDEYISGKKKTTREGQTIRASVWRDVIVEGQIVIKAGTPVLVRVDSFRKAKIAGTKGKITLGAYETTLINNSTIQLDGGYHKEGRGRVALAVTLSVLIFLPLIFIKGKKAKLETGTVFDAYVDQTVTIDVPGYSKPNRRIDLTSIANQGFAVEVLYDEMEAVEKPEVFPFAIQAPVGNSGEFVIDRLNGASIDPIKLIANRTGTDEEMEFWHGEVSIKKLAKKLKKGINTFEISTIINGERVSQEVVLDIQI